MPPPARSPLVDAQIERVLSRYRDSMPPEALAELRDLLEDMLTTHPVVSRWVTRLGPAPNVLRSGEVPKEAEPDSHAREDKKAKGRR